MDNRECRIWEKSFQVGKKKNDGVMDDKSGDDIGEVKRIWRRDESRRGWSRRG